jgi:hypothetical protein
VKRLLIGGDSWGCGEWPNPGKGPYKVTHLGLEQYLLDDGFCVKNCSVGAQSNKDSVDRVNCELELDSYDCVIWFQSDPLRDLRPYTNFNSQFTSYQELLDLSNRLLNSHYKMLNQSGHKVICVGGCTKLDPDIRNYENLIPLVDSMIELLLPNFTAPKVWHSDWLFAIKSNINEDLLDQLLVNKKIQDSLRDKPIFKPDGMHPNREGHRVLFNTIKEFLIKGEC